MTFLHKVNKFEFILWKKCMAQYISDIKVSSNVSLDIDNKTITVDGTEMSLAGLGGQWPNYSNPTNIKTAATSNSGWTATNNGWIIVARGTSADLVKLYIDNVQVWNSGTYDAHFCAGMVPIAKNSIAKAIVTGDDGVAAVDSVTFIPAKTT